MKRWILAGALFLGWSAGYASADYVILIVNLPSTGGGTGVLGGGGGTGNIGVPGGIRGMQPGGVLGGGQLGALGMGGGMQPGGGALGVGGVPQGGALGIGGFQPGGALGMGGVPPGGAAGMGGFPQGGALGAGGGPPQGMGGSFRPPGVGSGAGMGGAGQGGFGMVGSAPPAGVGGGLQPGGALGAGGGPPQGMGGSFRPPGVGPGAGMAGGFPPGGVGSFPPPGGGMGGVGSFPPPGGGSSPPPGVVGPGGGLFGMMAGMGQAARQDFDDNPRFIVAIVEVENLNRDPDKRLEHGLPINVRHHWGTAQLRAQTPNSKTILLKSGGKPLPAVIHLFEGKYKDVFTGSPSPPKVQELADWCLAHGLVDKFAEVMDKLVELDKANPAAVAYAKVRDALKQPPQKNEVAGSWRAKLLQEYRVTEKEGYHYALVHSPQAGTQAEMDRVLQTLENTFRGFYYWWALRGVSDLTIPRERQVAVLTDKTDDLTRFHSILTSGPMVGDGFFARREGLTVLSSRRLDEPYDALDKYSNIWWSQGFQKEALLTGKKGAGHPRTAALETILDAQMVALVLKAMEVESLLHTVSHDASRQLLYAAGLLPRNVSAPEWFLFGMGSFFETSPQSPWPTIGAPSFYWLPLFKELKKDNRFQKTPNETLRAVVTDHYFRTLPPRGEPDTPTRRAYEEALRKARTASWSLAHFMAREKLPELRRYCKELGKLPRDLELDESTLLEAFARAVGAVDAANKPDLAKLGELANRWFAYIDNTTLESEDLRKQIQQYYREMQLASRSEGGK